MNETQSGCDAMTKATNYVWLVETEVEKKL